MEEDLALVAMINKANTAQEIIKNLQENKDKKYQSFQVDIFRTDTLEQLSEPKEFSLRVFLRSCQNLSAVDNRVQDIRNQLAGDVALSSADPFIYMKIVKERPLKIFDGRTEAKEETLNPAFYID